MRLGSRSLVVTLFCACTATTEEASRIDGDPEAPVSPVRLRRPPKPVDPYLSATATAVRSLPGSAAAPPPLAPWIASARPQPTDPFSTAVASLRFTDVTDEAGLGMDGAHFGASWADLDGDQDPDLVVPNAFSSALQVYENEGGGHFSGVATLPVGTVPFATAVGDYDNDGVPDIVTSGAGRTVLFKGHPGGSWSVAYSWDYLYAASSMIGFYDMDQDGWLDIYVALDPVGPPPSTPDYPEHQAWCNDPCNAPAVAPPSSAARNRVYLQTPPLGFVDVTTKSPLADPFWSLAFAFAHWLPGDEVALFVGNDSTPNGFWKIPLTPNAQSLICPAGLTVCIGTMGVLPVDLDRDGLLDILATNSSDHVAYLNLGDGTFTEGSDALGFTEASVGLVGWGEAAGDFDNDGDLDLGVANAPPPGFGESAPDVPQHPLFLMYDGGRYHSLNSSNGFPWFSAVGDTYGAHAADYDKDGDVDLLFVEPLGRLWLFRNDTQSAGHWLKLGFRGTSSNRSAIGTLVRVHVGAQILVQEWGGVSGAAGQSEPVLHFGLGEASHVDRIDILFPSGKTLVLGSTPAGQQLTLVEPKP